MKENARPRSASTISKRSNVDVKGAIALPLPAPMATNRFKTPLSPIPTSPNTPKPVYKRTSNQEEVHIQILLHELQRSEYTIKRMAIVQRKLENVIGQLVDLLKTK